MKAKDFLLEFEETDFPRLIVPWLERDNFDPPFTMAELNQMQKQGIIELNVSRTCFRLTRKAAELRLQLTELQ